MWAERIATPANTGDTGAGLAEQCVVEGDGERCLWWQLGEHSAADDGEEVVDGKTLLTEDAVGGTPIEELTAASSQHTGNGVTAQAEEGAQGEGLGSVCDALLAEGDFDLAPELLEGV